MYSCILVTMIFFITLYIASRRLIGQNCSFFCLVLFFHIIFMRAVFHLCGKYTLIMWKSTTFAFLGKFFLVLVVMSSSPGAFLMNRVRMILSIPFCFFCVCIFYAIIRLDRWMVLLF